MPTLLSNGCDVKIVVLGVPTTGSKPCFVAVASPFFFFVVVVVVVVVVLFLFLLFSLFLLS